MTVGELREALALIPEQFNNTEFVVFCASNGVRVVFDHADLGFYVTQGDGRVSLLGKQDPNQS